MKKVLSVSAIILSGLLWGTMGIFVRHFAALGLSSMEIVSLRAIVAVVLLPAALLIYRPSLFKIRFKDIWCFAGAGILSFLMFSWCYFYTMEQTSLSVAAVLLYSAPVMVTVMSAMFFKEKLTKVKIIACALAFTGCFLVTGVLTGEAKITAIGMVSGLCSAFGYALYSIFGRVAFNRGYHPLTVTTYAFVFALIGLIPLTNFVHIYKTVTASPFDIFFALLMGVITTVLPYVLYTCGLENIESGKASVMASVEPVAASLAGWWVFGEKPDGWGIAGMALVLVAIVIINIKNISDIS